MCGRFSLAYEDWGEMLDYFGVENAIFTEPPRYNVAPGQDVAAVIGRPDKRRIGMLKWGLIPSFAKDEKTAIKSINARLETVASKPMFRTLMARKRCVIPADGFYEWKRIGESKRPYRIVTKDRPFFGFAGLYDTWVGQDGHRVSTCVILTTKPNDVMREIHDRMPVILTREMENLWLDSTVSDIDHLVERVGSYPSDLMRAYPVSPIVGNVRNDSPECLQPIAE
ncbi:SOS response-associated peptidase [Alicyclobacillus ferrooxydans]|uniref:Abasic site processing protein n=1 Tax=Alicyclobacillus ferrooxydans TaxID=471514 RepID=A0A0P9CQZ0_9BACL|nr:SOS response-associated peptidase [Alicyclobacillus ferrooxydans]KPV45284.1 hypothetical protein AN477_02590 [Alicyclobacillus ferrooxydans]